MPYLAALHALPSPGRHVLAAMQLGWLQARWVGMWGWTLGRVGLEHGVVNVLAQHSQMLADHQVCMTHLTHEQVLLAVAGVPQQPLTQTPLAGRSSVAS